ncbi:TonB-dependent receptor [Confluentibacter flavum]|uniref:TonB-dependent receptor n=1 Tax=Confluentibacter flavum TaxID=1909700 RepID=A0A2N3HHT5_9FLAO|nr:TonB-dependent receptor [Confluentibacter flavum]PKQ44540.1 hypothetical protein CSW08_12880 [Confluentibacter flavum]
MKHHKIILSKHILCIIFTLLYFTIQAQNTIKGKVLNEDNEPLLGVNILVKGTNQGTVTDLDGEFTFMDLSEGSTLEIIFIGYERQEISATQDMVVYMKIDKNSLQEVIVSAENRNVSAQKVAISMDLVSGVKLQDMGITDLKQLQNLTPSLAFNQNTFFTQVFIRGVGSDVGSAELQDQAATLSIDGEFINRPVALNSSLFDVERIEVLKGPQGTLYGRNSTAGAINILAVKPRLNITEGNVSAQYGNYNSLKLNAAVNVPLGDKAAIRVAAMSDSHDGYRESKADPSVGVNGDIDNGKVWGARLGLMLKPTDKFNIYIAGELNKTDQQANSQYGVRLDSTGLPPYDFKTNLPEDFDVATAGSIKIDQAALRTRMSYDFGGAVLTYTGGYRHVDLEAYQPLNGFVPETFSFDNKLIYDTQSHEIRLNGESDHFIWQAGLFHGNEDQKAARGLVLPAASGAFGGSVPYLNWFDVDVNSKTTGIFGQATIDLSETLAFTGGLRYTKDKKSSDGFNIQQGPFGPPGTPAYFYPNPPQAGDAGTGQVPGAGNGSWSQVTWLTSLEYKPTENNMFFGKVSTGYKSGGFTVRDEFDAENLIAYEIGTKNYLANRKLRLNGSVFVYKYTDQQVSVFIDTQAGADIENAGSSDYFGVEIEGDYMFSSKDRINFNFNYLNAEFKELTTLVNTIGNSAIVANLAGNKPAQTPELIIVAGYNHTFSLGEGTLDFGIGTMFKSDYYLQVFNFEMDKQKAYTKTDINLTYRAGNGKWELGAFLNNLEDNRIINYASFNGSNINIYNWSFGSPRLFGLRTSYKF